MSTVKILLTLSLLCLMFSNATNAQTARLNTSGQPVAQGPPKTSSQDANVVQRSGNAGTLGIPTLSFGLTEAGKPTEVANALKVLVMLTVLSLAPAILILMTSFTRIVVVLSFLRQAIGTQQMPPNQLIVGLSLFLTFFVMAPTFKNIQTTAIEPYMKDQLTQWDALSKAESPMRAFMFQQTREKDIEAMMGMAKLGRPQNRDAVPTYVLIPSFILSELKTAFQMGFLLYLPFLVIDMVVSSVLMAMGMMMLPPVVISLPFKLLLFVLVDGWQLVVGSLVKSFG
ncbi:MAG TPA: flagellar type III secretion system pore protein FliP [Oligoflexia bacterium]|nr:flagellar type III secretion system pore protein FliP [Oligoflexia bacterium]